jgi:hypothetical protein
LPGLNQEEGGTKRNDTPARYDYGGREGVRPAQTDHPVRQGRESSDCQKLANWIERSLRLARTDSDVASRKPKADQPNGNVHKRDAPPVEILNKHTSDQWPQAMPKAPALDHADTAIFLRSGSCTV